VGEPLHSDTVSSFLCHSCFCFLAAKIHIFCQMAKENNKKAPDTELAL